MYTIPRPVQLFFFKKGLEPHVVGIGDGGGVWKPFELLPEPARVSRRSSRRPQNAVEKN